MKLINKTGVPYKNPGDGLSAKEINAINSTVNNTVDVANVYLKDYCNANVELKSMTKQLTLEEATAAVPVDRRTKGMILRYLNIYGIWTESSFVGPSVSEEDWKNGNNWAIGTSIDGGEW